MSENEAVDYNDLENWMSKLPGELKSVPLIYLAIPGSHDSMTYGITRNSGLAPDADPILKNFYGLFQGTILRWTKTQEIDAFQQLLFGIRYFDLRLATKNGTDKIYFTHGVYAGEIDGPLKQIKEFIDFHPEEVVILDFQHFYGFTKDDHFGLIKYIVRLFGPQLVPRQADLAGITLNTLRRWGRQVVIVYRNQMVYSSEFWSTQMLPSPWPQQDNISGLHDFLLHVKRPPATGFVHQAVLTPTAAFILLRITSNLKEKCAKPVQRELYPKLLEFTPGRPTDRPGPVPVNVVIADFVNLDEAVFSKTIIQLNKKLLQNQRS